MINITLKVKDIKTNNISSILGPKGINIKEFINIFNEKTKKYKKGTMIPTKIKIIKKKIKVKIKKPTTTYLIKDMLKINKGSSDCNKIICKINKKIVDKIIKIKKKDLNSIDKKKNRKTIISISKSMGIEYVK